MKLKLAYKLRVRDKTNIYIAILIMLAFLPVASSFNGTLTNLFRLTITLAFLLRYYSRRIREFNSILLILALSLVTNLLYYTKAYYTATTFMYFINASTMCWVFMIIALYLRNNIAEKDRMLLENFLFTVSFVTCITTIIGGIKYPQVIRSTVLSGADLIEAKQMLARQNIANWPTIYAYTFTLPFWIQAYKNTNKKKYLSLVALIFMMILVSEITFACLFATAFLIFLFFEPKNKQKIMFQMILALLIFMLAYFNLTSILLWVSNLMTSIGMNMLSFRIDQLYRSVIIGELTGDGAARFGLYGTSIQTFLTSPFIGYKISKMGFNIIGFHSQIFDMMAATGIIGTVASVIPFVFITKKIRKKLIDFNQKFFFDVTLLAFLSLCCANPVWTSQGSFFAVFGLVFLLPQQKECRG